MRRRFILCSGLRRRTSSLLTAGLTALARRARIEAAFVPIKRVRPVAHAWLCGPRLALPRCTGLDAHIIGSSRIRAVLCPRTGRAVAASIVVAAAILIDARVAAVDIAVDDFVVLPGAIISAGLVALAAIVSGHVATGPAVSVETRVVVLNVVVSHVPMDRVVAANVVHVHGAIHDRSINPDIPVAVVDVDVVPEIYAASAAADPPAVPATCTPPSCLPPGVIEAAPTAAESPAEIQVEPGPDRKSNAKRDRGTIVGTAIVNDRRIVDRHVDIFRLVRANCDVVVVLQNFLLR